METIKDLAYWENNCEENYLTTPISVLRYITELEKSIKLMQTAVSGSAFAIEELHVLHSGLIAAKPRLNEKTRRYKETLILIDKLSLMIGEYYR